jgi:hypothetical protein
MIQVVGGSADQAMHLLFSLLWRRKEAGGWTLSAHDEKQKKQETKKKRVESGFLEI